MNRMYSILTVKAVEEDKRIIRGVATTPNPDRVGGILEPLGVQFKNPMPLLHQHDHTKPVGTVKFDKPTKDGINFEAKLPIIEEPGPLRDRVETAWGEVKAGLVKAVSIGFRALEYSWMDEGGIRFIATEVLELSPVSVPANADAVRLLPHICRLSPGGRSHHQWPLAVEPDSPDRGMPHRLRVLVHVRGVCRQRGPWP